MIVAVTGSPGVGKSTLSKLISRDYSLTYIDFEKFLIDNKLYSDFDSNRMSYIIDVDKARKFFDKYRFPDNSVLDGHNITLIYPCVRLDYVILLRCSPYVLYERLKRKGYPENKIYENVQAEILDIIAYDVYTNCKKEKVLEIDVSEGISNKYHIVKKFLNGMFPSGYREPIDWLSLLTSRGDLNRFMVR